MEDDGGAAAAAEEEKALRDSQGWPFPDRVAHKNWKIRKAAFDDAKAACERVTDARDPVLDEYGTPRHGLYAGSCSYESCECTMRLHAPLPHTTPCAIPPSNVPTRHAAVNKRRLSRHHSLTDSSRYRPIY